MFQWNLNIFFIYSAPLDRAIEGGSIEIVKLLLQFKSRHQICSEENPLKLPELLPEEPSKKNDENNSNKGN